MISHLFPDEPDTVIEASDRYPQEVVIQVGQDFIHFAPGANRERLADALEEAARLLRAGARDVLEVGR